MAGSITHTKQATGTNDATKQVSKDAWNDTHTFSLTKSDVSLGNVDNTSDATKFTNPNVTGELTVTQATVNTPAIAVAAQAQTGASSAPVLDLKTTWNTSDWARGILLDITNTASSAGSYYLDVRVGGVSEFTLRRGSNYVEFAAPSTNMYFTSDGAMYMAAGSQITRWAFTATGKLESWGYGDIIALDVGQTYPGTYTGSSTIPLAGFGATWNTSGLITLIKANVTDTASAAGSLLLDLQKNGTTMFAADKSGIFYSIPIAVGSLPAAGTAGRRAFVTDANATTFASIVAAGGANKLPVYDDGTNWRIG